MNRKIELALTFSFIALLAAAFVQDAFAVSTYKIGNVFLKIKVELIHPDGNTTEVTDTFSASYPAYNLLYQAKVVDKVRFSWFLYDKNPDYSINTTVNPARAPEIEDNLSTKTLVDRTNWESVGDRSVVVSQDGDYSVYRLYTVTLTAQEIASKTRLAQESIAYHSLKIWPFENVIATYKGKTVETRFESDKIVLNLQEDGKGFQVTSPPVIEQDPNLPKDTPVIGDGEPVPADGDPIICTNDCNEIEQASFGLIAAIGIIGAVMAFSYTKVMKATR